MHILYAHSLGLFYICFVVLKQDKENKHVLPFFNFLKIIACLKNPYLVWLIANTPDKTINQEEIFLFFSNKIVLIKLPISNFATLLNIFRIKNSSSFILNKKSSHFYIYVKKTSLNYKQKLYC